MKIKITGFASAEAKVWTVADLRELVAWCDKYRISGSCGLDWSDRMVFIDLTSTGPVVAKMIECRNHIPPDKGFDVVINTHKHANDYPANYEEALEEALEDAPLVDIPQFDWVTRDRYNDPGRPE